MLRELRLMNSTKGTISGCSAAALSSSSSAAANFKPLPGGDDINGRLPTYAMTGESQKKIFPALILCFFLGIFGAHRFYVGKTGTAIAQIFTLGGLGIWTLVDFVMIVVGEFSDSDGNKIVDWI